MEKLKAKFIKLEIDGTMYEGFIQEVREAAEATSDQTRKSISSDDRSYSINVADLKSNPQ